MAMMMQRSVAAPRMGSYAGSEDVALIRAMQKGKGGRTLGGGVGQRRHGRPLLEGMMPSLTGSVQQFPCSAWVLDGRALKH